MGQLQDRARKLLKQDDRSLVIQNHQEITQSVNLQQDGGVSIDIQGKQAQNVQNKVTSLDQKIKNDDYMLLHEINVKDCKTMTYNEKFKQLVYGIQKGIIFHQIDENGLLAKQIIFISLNETITSICLSKNADLMICASEFNIKIWKLEKQQYQCIQTINDIQKHEEISKLVIHDRADQFFVGKNDKLNIWSKDPLENIWKLKQSFDCFRLFQLIDSDTFALAKNYIKIYKRNIKTNVWTYENSISIDKHNEDILHSMCFLQKNELIGVVHRQIWKYILKGDKFRRLERFDSDFQYDDNFELLHNNDSIVCIVVGWEQKIKKQLIFRYQNGQLIMNQKIKGNFVGGCLIQKGKLLILYSGNKISVYQKPSFFLGDNDIK